MVNAEFEEVENPQAFGRLGGFEEAGRRHPVHPNAPLVYIDHVPSAPPVVLTIAGFDPSSGAGITADIKVIAAQECYGVACITALTVQSTQGVRRVEAVDPRILTDSLEGLAKDLAIEGVHIGMLANERIVDAVADFLGRVPLPHVVLDPILKSSSGAELLNAGGTRRMVERLFPLAELVTPNLDEATALANLLAGNAKSAVPPGADAPSLGASVEAMREATRRMHEIGAANVVVTGGHLEKATDLLSVTTSRGIEQQVLRESGTGRRRRMGPVVLSLPRLRAIWRRGGGYTRVCFFPRPTCRPLFLMLTP